MGCRLELAGYALEGESEAAVANLTASERAQVLLPSNRFRALSGGVDDGRGVISIKSTYSLRFRRGVIFSAATLVLLVPAGRTSSFGAASWTLTSSSRMYVEYDYPQELPGNAATLGGFVALLDQQPPVFEICNTNPIVVPTLPGVAYARPTWPEPRAVRQQWCCKPQQHTPLGRHVHVADTRCASCRRAV